MKALLSLTLLASLSACSLTPLYAGDSRALNPTNDPTISKWFQELRQPNNPRVSCCGEADAFEADEYEKGADGTYIAIITDGRGALADGTRVRVPPNKLGKAGERNPTGHGVIFLHIITRSEVEDDENPYGPADIGRIVVYCYVEPQGA